MLDIEKVVHWVRARKGVIRIRVEEKQDSLLPMPACKVQLVRLGLPFAP